MSAVEYINTLAKNLSDCLPVLNNDVEDLELKLKWEKETSFLLQTKVTEMSTRIDDLLDTLEERNRDYDNLQRECKRLNDEIQEEQEWAEALEKEREENKEEIDRLRKIIDNLSTLAQTAKEENENRKRFMKECGLEEHYQSKRQEPIFPGYGQTTSITEQFMTNLEEFYLDNLDLNN